MKTNEELKGTPNLMILQTAEDGGAGEMVYNKMRASVIWSTGAGWDHVSVSPYRRNYTPTWDDMCKLKRMFFHPEETVIEYHPAESQYVNIMPNCLHLWRPQHYEIPLPPPILVGVQNGMSHGEMERAIKDSYEHPYALTSGMLLEAKPDA